jgi:hypothetical protein
MLTSPPLPILPKVVSRCQEYKIRCWPSDQHKHTTTSPQDSTSPSHQACSTTTLLPPSHILSQNANFQHTVAALSSCHRFCPEPKDRRKFLLMCLSCSIITNQPAQDLGNATIVENNPPGVVYRATLPDKAFFAPAYPNGGNVKGSISAVASPNGIGVLVKVRFSNLPKEGGPFRKYCFS